MRDVEYTAGQRLDLHLPDSAEESPPIVVLLHGAGLHRKDYEGFATRLATAGAVVFNTDWDVLPPRKMEALDQIACAVRYAREEGTAVGADPDRLVLVGHSTAAVFAGEIATNGDAYAGDCSTAGSALPAALALISAAQVPGGAPWRYESLKGNPDLRVAIVHGVGDSVARPSLSERIERNLQEHGHDPSLHLLDGGHHDIVMVDVEGTGSIDPAVADPVITIILELAEQTKS